MILRMYDKKNIYFILLSIKKEFFYPVKYNMFNTRILSKWQLKISMINFYENLDYGYFSNRRILNIHNNNTYAVIAVINPIPINHSLIIVEYL